MARWHEIALIPLLALLGCGSGTQKEPAESLTVGSIRLVASESAARLAGGEVAAFLQMYKRAHVDLAVANTRGAMAELFGARADAIFIPRELSPDEDSVARANRIEIQGFRVGSSGVAIIVNRSNPVNQLALDQLRDIYSGRLTRWNRLGGSSSDIRVLWQDPNLGTYELMVAKVMAGEAPSAPAAYLPSDSAVIAQVASRQDAVGFVAVESLTPDALVGVKALGISEALGLPYYRPDLRSIWDQKYPLRHFFVFAYRKPAPRLVEGLVDYMLSNEGQRVVRDRGAVPSAVPVKFKSQQP